MPPTLVSWLLLASLLADPASTAAIPRNTNLPWSSPPSSRRAASTTTAARTSRRRSLSLSSTSTSLTAAAALEMPPHKTQSALLIRGGGIESDTTIGSTSAAIITAASHLISKAIDVFDPKDLIAKAACAFFIGQSTTAWLAPHRTCLKYGLTTSTLNVACNRKLATAYLASVAMMYGMLFQKCTVHTAIGSSAMVWMAEQLKARLYYEAEDIGRPILGEYLVGMAATVTALATLWHLPGASLAAQVSSLLLIANGLAFFVAPPTVCRLWGVPVQYPVPPTSSGKKLQQEYGQQMKEYQESVFLHRYMGVALVFEGVLHAVLAWGGSIQEAIGYAFGCLFCVNCWSFLKTSDFKRLARISLSVQSRLDWKKRVSKLFFPVFNLVVATTLLLGNADNSFLRSQPLAAATSTTSTSPSVQ